MIKSRGGEPISTTNEIKLKNTCIPNDFRIFGTPRKTRNIKFGSIESNVNNNTFYTDYTINAGHYKGSYTDLIENQSTTLSIESEVDNVFHAWIDYNDNGTFEENERITQKAGLKIPAGRKTTAEITPQTDAVKNTYLRMRILTDAEESNPCASMYADGNINDFAVRIVEKPQTKPEPTPVPYPQPTPDNPENYWGRVGINTEQPQVTLHIKEIAISQLPNGKLQSVSFPNFTSEERDTFQNVVEGTMIFNTTLKCLEIYKGTELKWQCIK